jgi:probable rRNA maturation factor
LVILDKKVLGLTPTTLERFILRSRRAVGLKRRVNVLITGSPAVRALNKEFRHKDKPTDVLSFPAEPRRKQEFAGEIAISADIAIQNALRLGHSAAEEIKILTLHGLLHLAGFDHERDNGKMARRESQLRRKLRLPVGLIERAHPKHDTRPTRKPGTTRGRA